MGTQDSAGHSLASASSRPRRCRSRRCCRRRPRVRRHAIGFRPAPASVEGSSRAVAVAFHASGRSRVGSSHRPARCSFCLARYVGVSSGGFKREPLSRMVGDSRGTGNTAADPLCSNVYRPPLRANAAARAGGSPAAVRQAPMMRLPTGESSVPPLAAMPMSAACPSKWSETLPLTVNCEWLVPVVTISGCP